MSKYRKKPVIIEAMRWTPPHDGHKLLDWLEDSDPYPNWSTADYGGKCVILIQTLEGTMAVNPGDWVIRGVQGEFYPCKSDIFDKTYDLVEE